MFCVGLDIHDKRIAICILSETGQVARRSQVRSIDEMMRVLEALPDRFEVCYEASRGYGHYHDLLSPIAARVTVAHPGRPRLIFRSKAKPNELVQTPAARSSRKPRCKCLRISRGCNRLTHESCRSSLIDGPTLARHHQ
jgi:hypothetical protein